MKVVVWIVEGTWETSVEAAASLDRDASFTLVHVAPDDVRGVAHGAHLGLLGRHSHHEPEPALAAASDEEARALLAQARERLGREAALDARRGRPEHEVIEAAQGADLLVLARDGVAQAGPKSLGRAGRFVVDHAPCPLLLVPGAAGPLPPAPPPPAPGAGRQPPPPLPSGGR